MPAASARSSARTPAWLLATATIGRPASISACRFVPSPLTRTPITSASRSPCRECLRGRPRTCRRREPEHDVARFTARPVDQPLALDEAHAGPREVELLLPVDARQLRGLAADQRAAGLAADLRRALDELGDLLQVEPVRGHVVEEE